MQPTQPILTSSTKSTATSKIVSIILIIIGGVVCLVALLMVITTAAGPKVHGTFVANDCTLQYGKYSSGSTECTGTFTTDDGKVSVTISNGNEVATPQIASLAEGKSFPAFASASSDSDVTSSSLIIAGSGVSALNVAFTILIIGALPLIIGILLLKGPRKGGPLVESGTSAAVQKLRDRQNGNR